MIAFFKSSIKEEVMWRPLIGGGGGGEGAESRTIRRERNFW